jgi:hypothetical protein
MPTPFPVTVRTEPLRVFYSYSHRDKELRNELKKQLRPLERENLIVTWDDGGIPAGEKWEPRIHKELEQADIVLLLVSADFIDSDYCYGIEFERAIERLEQGLCRVIPVNLRPCVWPRRLQELQALPTSNIPVTEWANRDTAFKDVAAAILAIANPERSATAQPPQPKAPPAEALRVRPAPSLSLAHLCDRGDQETGLLRSFQDLPRSKQRSPFLLVTCGAPQECHEAFIDRIRRSPLPRYMGMLDKPVNTTSPLDWPASFRDSDAPADIFGPRID